MFFGVGEPTLDGLEPGFGIAEVFMRDDRVHQQEGQILDEPVTFGPVLAVQQ